MDRKEFYVVLEIQNDGVNPAVVPVILNSLSEAKSRFYMIMAAAALSNVPYHGAMVFNDRMERLMWDVCDRRTDAEPEQAAE